MELFQDGMSCYGHLWYALLSIDVFTDIYISKECVLINQGHGSALGFAMPSHYQFQELLLTFMNPACNDDLLRRAMVRVIHTGNVMGSLADDKAFVDEVLRGSKIVVLNRIENMYSTLLRAFQQRFAQVSPPLDLY